MQYSKTKKIEVINWLNENYKTATYQDAIEEFNLKVKPKTIGRWYKSITGRDRKTVIKESKEDFLLDSKVTIKKLLEIEDKTLMRFQDVVDGEVPYQEIFRNIHNLDGNLTIKIDGTVKGLVETTMLIGNKRREIRGVLPLKDREVLALKREELNHKIETELSKQHYDLRLKEIELRTREIDLKLKETEAKIFLKE